MQGRRFAGRSPARRCFFTVIGKVGAALHGGVVGHDHALDAPPGRCRRSRRRSARRCRTCRRRRHLADLEEGRAEVEQAARPVAGAACRAVFGGPFAAAEADPAAFSRRSSDDQAAHGGGVGLGSRRRVLMPDLITSWGGSAQRVSRTVRDRSACGGSRWCRRRSRRAWRRATGGRGEYSLV